MQDPSFRYDSIFKQAPSTKIIFYVFKDLEFMDFFTLELCDTNIEDHNTHVYSSENISFEIID